MLTALAACTALTLQGASSETPVEVRGVWIPNSHSTFFDSRETVRDQTALLAEAGINVIFPVVWSKGHTLFDSAVAERVVGSRTDPRYGERDPLAEVLHEAHRHGIEVVPWFEYGFADGHVTFPGRAIERHPEWAAIGRDGKTVVKNGFPWLNSLAPGPQQFLTDLVVECATRYDVDGVQGDDRLPALPAEAGYDATTAALYREATGSAPPEDIHDAAWTQWRADRLTDYLAVLRSAVKAVSPDLVFSMAPGAPSWALRDYLQDQRTWVERGLVDALHPQLYTRDLDGYHRMAAETLAIEWLARRRDLVSPGVLSSFRDYFISKDLAYGSVATNRERGFAGEVWFYEKGLVREDGARGRDLRAGPYAAEARLPWRSSTTWRPRAVVAVPHEEDGQVTWSATAEVDGTYALWAQEQEGGPWRALDRQRLVAGQTTTLLRGPSGSLVAVEALIDRRAERAPAEATER
ncbi:MAG: family 10 glycosylhydrolase [Planctomycetota bacterium]|nr:family 10 glycosylhydrolase [Planctomycetota bacterium]